MYYQELNLFHHFTCDIYFSFEFDPYGFSFKELATMRIPPRSNSSGDLYDFRSSKGGTIVFSSTSTGDLWH